MSTIQREKLKGGWGFVDIGAKCRALLHHPLQTQRNRQGTLTADWLKEWKIQTPSTNPPQIQRIPAELDYQRHFTMGTAYIPPQQESESCKKYKRRIYVTMVVLLREMPTFPTMRVLRLWPPTDWNLVWANLHETPVPEDVKMEWYRAIHDIIPTHDRLHRIKMAATNQCRHCHAPDTLRHRLTECGEGRLMWDWTRGRLAVILRNVTRSIPEEWLLRPTLSIWPPKRRRAVLWILAPLVAYRLQQRHKLTCQD
jgi:hypothetical protein